MSNPPYSVGQSREVVVVDDLRRTQIVQYAGASGDFNPLHTDEVFAVEAASRPSVLAHGMLTMGLTGRVLTDWFGDGRLFRFGVRFLKPVWPGDTLTTSAVITEITTHEGRDLALVELRTTNQDGDLVVTGTASVWLSAPTAASAVAHP
jgi:acyl dehydratase